MDKFDIEVEKARKRVAEFDKLDGFSDRHLGTILAALECGLRRPDTGAQYDAYVMLKDISEKP